MNRLPFEQGKRRRKKPRSTPIACTMERVAVRALFAAAKQDIDDLLRGVSDVIRLSVARRLDVLASDLSEDIPGDECEAPVQLPSSPIVRRRLAAPVAATATKPSKKRVERQSPPVGPESEEGDDPSDNYNSDMSSLSQVVGSSSSSSNKRQHSEQQPMPCREVPPTMEVEDVLAPVKEEGLPANAPTTPFDVQAFMLSLYDSCTSHDGDSLYRPLQAPSACSTPENYAKEVALAIPSVRSMTARGKVLHDLALGLAIVTARRVGQLTWSETGRIVETGSEAVKPAASTPIKRCTIMFELIWDHGLWRLRSLSKRAKELQEHKGAILRYLADHPEEVTKWQMEEVPPVTVMMPYGRPPTSREIAWPCWQWVLCRSASAPQ